MYDEERPDLEWDEEVERGQLVAAQAHAQGISSQQQELINPRERAIRPLPKRQRLSEQELSGTISQEQGGGGGVDKKQRQPNEDEQQDEGGLVVPASASAASREPALEYRTAADDDYHDQRGGTASNHPSKARDEDETATKTSLDSSRPEDFDDDDRCRHLDDSPPTSPATSRAGRSFKEDDEPEEELQRSPDYFALFGSEGQEIRRSLRHASTFSAAGLCGGLGLAGLHPSLIPPAERRAGRASGSARAGGAAGDDEVDEDGYALVERAYTSDHGGRLVPVARVGGNNKKKRKIPGVSVGTGGDDDDRTFDAEDGPEPTTVIGPDYNGRAPGIRSDFGSDPPTSKGDSRSRSRLGADERERMTDIVELR
ncbi:hypothetical protein BCR35DRAFT_91624 [Leucosporidium creatinivorum]|uniref:Uncharacterized protein n=1 Tax=Leucosporidium creatinivorum TaxID=106004 RepID=A0A1Y2F8L6_9BASI|nr:hypothetical protein BCR35DRAFT_91624 [Leucosporidium creatinivorum]